MYKVYKKEKILVNKNKTTANPRIPMDDFLDLPAFDLTFAWNAPKELFLTSRDSYANYRMTADVRRTGNGRKNKSYDLSINISGSKKRLHNVIVNPPKDHEGDHINQITNDIRIENVRVASHEQNQRNKSNADQGEVLQHENGLCFVRFPLEPDASQVLYERREEATKALYSLQDKHYGEFGKRRSKEIADKYDTHLFDDIFLSIFSSADHDLIHEIVEMPFVFENDTHYFYNEARIDLHVLNAKYMFFHKKAIETLEADMVSADADERAELYNMLTWLQEGRLIINMSYFISEFENVVCKHLAYKRACEQGADLFATIN